jgi:hypothetical protein
MTDPSVILMVAITNVTLPAGGAMSLAQCDQNNCGPTLDPTDPNYKTCLPYCK